MTNFSPPTGAAIAFKRALIESGQTQRVVSAKTKISQTALTKFVTGRPPTSELLRRIMSAFPESLAREILLAHLNDEIIRLGRDPGNFIVLNKDPDVFLVRGDLARLNAIDKSVPSIAPLPQVSSKPHLNWPGGNRDIDS